MTYRILPIFLFLIFSTFLNAQNHPLVKKAVETFKEGDHNDAIKLMRKALKKENTAANWYLLLDMYQVRFQSLDHNPEEAKMAEALEALLKGEMDNITVSISSPKEQALEDLLNTAREVRMYTLSSKASQILRNYLVDYTPDKDVKEEAKEELGKAEVHFMEKDYGKAIEQYKKAIAIAPDYYQATVFLGDAFWYELEMDSAIYYFDKAIAMHNDLLEPHKYRVDALIDGKRYKEAIESCFNGIYLYPDLSLYAKLGKIYQAEGKGMELHFVPRGCTVNQIGLTQDAVKKAPWKAYRAAKEEVRSLCNEKGIIEKNERTTSKYLEVYAWEQMLKGNVDKYPELLFAKKVMEEGYLDCYVFSSAFHYDFFDQYQDFLVDNKERLRYFVENYLVGK